MEKKRIIFIALAVLLVGGGAGAYYYLDSPVKPGNDNGTGDDAMKDIPPNPDTPPPEEGGKVVEVIDGITIRLESGHIIRYVGVDTPKVGNEVQCFGKESVLANESMIGKTVRLEEEPLLARSRDGAWTRYVFFTDDREENDQAPMTNDQSSPNDQMTNEETTPSEDATGSPTPEPVNTDLSEAPERDPADPVKGSEIDVGESEEEAEEEKPDEIMVNERILEGGFGFPIVSAEMKYGERLLAAARYGSATGKGLWSRCEPTQDEATGRFTTQTVEDCVIKGKVTPAGRQIYRTPECPAYKETIVVQSDGDQWFCAEDIAQEAGFEKAPDCK